MIRSFQFRRHTFRCLAVRGRLQPLPYFIGQPPATSDNSLYASPFRPTMPPWHSAFVT
ncbi:hypothetical protein HNQ59_000810 [Chitinivorax tropicus]|uniref:Uncharacterized protein n=1 Tax=Chitinivorax tropicus TaxID=714531 RepID=A0A840MQL8_9PROT|nr:hypothetical protein [Chitinivorax tropicus]